MSSAPIQVLTDDTFEGVLDQDKVIVVYFWAPWCEPCKSFKPIYQDVASSMPEVVFASIDVEEHTQLRDDFVIRSVPTIMVFRDRVALCKESGEMTKSTLSDLVQQAQGLDMRQVHAEIAKKMLDE